MAFKKRNNQGAFQAIIGFVTLDLGKSLTGRLMKFVPPVRSYRRSDRKPGYFLIKVSEDTSCVAVLDDKSTTRATAKSGKEIVGIGSCWSLEQNLGAHDEGKLVRITFTGAEENPHGDKRMRIFDVEVDEESAKPANSQPTGQDDDVPF